MTALSFGDIAGAFADRKDPDRKRTPRRNSYDIDDKRAQVFQPVRHGWDWIGAVLQAFDELLHDQRVTRYKESDRLQDGDRRILLSFLKLMDFKTGQLDPSYQELADRAGCHRATAIEACKRFAKWLGLRWVRRTIVAETVGQAGPQREQISNAFYFDISQAPRRVWATFKAAMRRKLIKRRGKAPEGLQSQPKRADDPTLMSRLNSLGNALEQRDSASRKSRHYPGVED
ncbi:helix-turn-helix domain-containing protein [Sphingobium sp. BYY-5]|uniref:helix-turn-helix domain-containing protein n=1 Tax=Sphingobium sp. BYY-5 TaxID=2926400 RepID=UPI001FA6D906|nr:helix-turn-helix domain-containing protein [Sphingobium sp. BYY-5]MCI4588631.1 helix-turn-helix domain-containing protein [Sphingobium sp. BYY-5]